MPNSICQQQFYSEDYYDLIYENIFPGEQLCTQQLNSQYSYVCIPRLNNPPLSLKDYAYGTIPKCYGLSDTRSLEASGIYIIQRYPGLELKGNGVLMGFVDTGADYTIDAFKNSFGTTRIKAIWDQTIPSETEGDSVSYGTVYSEDMINRALENESPFDIVPTTDENGHGTALTSVAAGSDIASYDFSGAAPECSIAVVKLKEAKENLKSFYGINTDAPCFAETDIMAGIRFLEDLAEQLDMPLVIALGLETNLGEHTGASPLGNMIDDICKKRRRCIVSGTGNEANNRHHFESELSEGQMKEVEIRVDASTESFTLELWGSIPDLYSVGVVSPTGEELQRISPTQQEVFLHRFVFEQTDVQIEYQFSTILSGAQLVQLRFKNLVEGIWIIKVFAVNDTKGRFHMWLPINAFISGEVFFIESDPEVTLSDLSTVEAAISAAAYDSEDNSIYLKSGRGYTRTDRIKPDIAAPGVSVYAALPDNRYSARTGSSLASAVCGGAVALIMEWAVVKNNRPFIDAAQIKALLIRGAQSERFRTYPNREWGYGILNLYESFETLRLS